MANHKKVQDANRAPCRSGCFTQSQRHAFTLIELVVVMGVIAAMAALTYGYLDYARHRAELAATEGLVQSVATAIVNHQGRYWQYLDGGQMRSVPIFDVNRDGLLDGDPVKINAITSGSFSDAIVDSGYSGFLGTTATDLPIRNLDEQAQVIDSWGQVLRINFDAQRYGANRFGIWSIGSDGIADNLDDVKSWESVNE